MRARVEALLGSDCSRMWVSTFHSLCAPTAAARGAGHRPVARFRDLRLAPISSRSSNRRCKALHIDDSFVQPRARSRGSATRRTAWKARIAMAGARAELEPPRRAHRRRSTRHYRGRAEGKPTRSTSTTCCSRPSSLFEQSERVRSKYAEQFRFVMVDEYQDTNRPQYLLIRRLAGDPPQPVRRRRSRSVDLQVARRRSPQHPRTSSRTFREATYRQARTELPVDADHPRRGVGGHQPEPQPQGQAPRGPIARAATRIVVLPRRRRARGGRFHHAHGPQRRWPTTWKRRSRCSTAPTRSRGRLKTR